MGITTHEINRKKNYKVQFQKNLMLKSKIEKKNLHKKEDWVVGRWNKKSYIQLKKDSKK